MSQKPTTVDAYLERVDPARREELRRILELVRSLVPEVEEKLSYGMPTLGYRGQALVYVTASQKHMSFYPSSMAIEELRPRLTGYTLSAHAIQFTLERRLPDELIEDLVLAHARLIDADRGGSSRPPN